MISNNKFLNVNIMAIFFRIITLNMIIILAFPASLLAQDSPQPMLELQTIAHKFIKSHYPRDTELTVKFAPWDSRVRLIHCASQNISASFLGKQQRLGNISIALHCDQSKKWTFYLRAFISIKQHIVFSRHLIKRGTVLTNEDLVIEKVDISNVNSVFFHDPNMLIGKLAKRNIPMGKRITSNQLKLATIVKKGQEVMIIAQIAGLLIRTKGKALMDGTKGQMVKVKNISSEREIQATVIAPNVVKVIM